MNGRQTLNKIRLRDVKKNGHENGIRDENMNKNGLPDVECHRRLRRLERAGEAR